MQHTKYEIFMYTNTNNIIYDILLINILNKDQKILTNLHSS
jgi:hypothetical protein